MCQESKTANVPKLRPIEDFWTEIKRLVYADNWQAKNLHQLRNQIKLLYEKNLPKSHT